MAVSITLMEAYMIETLRSKGMSPEDLVQAIQTNDIHALLAIDDSFDYTDLIETAKKDLERIQTAIMSGYTIKFVSKNGIKRLLNVKFGLESGKNYDIEGAKFSNIHLEEDAFKTFQTMLSPNWRIEGKRTTHSGITFDIRHQTE